MAKFRFTFEWEETPEMDYDALFDQLMFLGADDIKEEIIDDEPVDYKPSGRLKKKRND